MCNCVLLCLIYKLIYCRHPSDKLYNLCYNTIMIEEILNKIGLDEKEVIVYLSVLKYSKITASELTKKTKFKRTTIYAVLERLLDKKLIGKMPNKNIDVFFPLPTENINALFAKEESLLLKKKELAKRASLELSQFGSNAVFSIPKTTFVPEEDFVDFSYANTDKWNKSMQEYDSTLWGFSTPTYIEKMKEYVNWWSKKTEDTIRLKLFSAKTPSEVNLSKQYPHREIKLWPGKAFETSLTVQGDFVIIEHTNTQPFYLIEIFDKVLAENLREMFKVMWTLIK